MILLKTKHKLVYFLLNFQLVQLIFYFIDISLFSNQSNSNYDVCIFIYFEPRFLFYLRILKDFAI